MGEGVKMRKVEKMKLGNEKMSRLGSDDEAEGVRCEA
jgi:hypothetical protein